METTHEFEAGDSDAPVESARERQSEVDDGAGETDNPAIGSEWTDFAGVNEYKRDLSAPEWDPPADTVVGREWQDFAGTNEYETGETSPPGPSSTGTSRQNDSNCFPQFGD